MKFSEASGLHNKQNIGWINNLRLISMFAVIVLHTTSPLLFAIKGTPLRDWITGDIYNALVRFAVPVFVMITGALSLNREYELSDFLKKRIGRLILPFIFWSLVYIGYRLYNEEITFTMDIWADTKFVLHQLISGSYYHLWYVYELMGLYLVMPILSKFVQNATEQELIYFLVIWYITMLIGTPYLSKFNAAIDLHNFTGYMGYLVLGYYLTYKKFSYKALPLVAAIVFILFVILIAGGTYYLQFKDHQLKTFFYEPVGPVVAVFAASALLMAKYIKVQLNPKIKSVFDNASKYTLGIYLSHALVLNFFDLNDINYAMFSPLISIPLIALACFLLAWLLVYIMSKIPGVKYLVG